VHLKNLNIVVYYANKFVSCVNGQEKAVTEKMRFLEATAQI